MRKPDRIHFDKLLGFELLARELSKALDFQDESFGAKLGAKVGELTPGPRIGSPEPTLPKDKAAR